MKNAIPMQYRGAVLTRTALLVANECDVLCDFANAAMLYGVAYFKTPAEVEAYVQEEMKNAYPGFSIKVGALLEDDPGVLQVAAYLSADVPHTTSLELQ